MQQLSPASFLDYLVANYIHTVRKRGCPGEVQSRDAEVNIRIFVYRTQFCVE